MLKKHLTYLLCVLVLASLLTACVVPDEGQRHSFTLNNTGEDGAEVSWKGYTDGYRPSATETIHLTLTNRTDQPWDGRLCVQLLEPQPSSVVMPLADQEFDLDPGNGFARDVQIEMPAALAPGIYGLALVVHKPSGPVVNVIPVQVGTDEQEPFHGEWSTEAALEACPAPQTADVEPTPTAPTEPPAQVIYTEVEVIEAGLRVEVPDSWQQLSTGWAWSPVGDGLPQVGVAWRDLQPPEEPEAALLPSPSQVLDSEPLDLGWGSGRRVTLEVYAPSAGTDDTQAPVQSVETHVLIVVQESGNRRAYDLVAAAGSLEELTAIEPIFQHLLDTAKLAH